MHHLIAHRNHALVICRHLLLEGGMTQALDTIPTKQSKLFPAPEEKVSRTEDMGTVCRLWAKVLTEAMGTVAAKVL